MVVAAAADYTAPQSFAAVQLVCSSQIAVHDPAYDLWQSHVFHLEFEKPVHLYWYCGQWVQILLNSCWTALHH